ncbi:MAG: ComEC/Rec2 family competence protein [Paludibacteraceae bacterium]|nr:ComEC/Rec2 family competence protein [Paludibacteraceae bacterium]
MRWLAAHTWLIALVPLVVIILISGYVGKPLNLLKDTEVDYIGKDTVLAMRLQSNGQERAKTIRYDAEMEDGSKVLLYLQKDSLAMPQLGDILMVKTKVERGGRLGDFDYGLYLRRHGIIGSCWAYRRNWQVIGHEEDRNIIGNARRCQYRLHEQYRKMGIDGKELGILSALTLGYREELDKDVQRAFSASGAMHVLAVSGLHTGIVWGIVIWVLTLGGWRKPLYEERWKRWLLSTLIITILWGYAFITGLSPSVMRSALMLTFVECSFLFKQQTSRWNAILAAALIILIINPLSLWSVSFQLSFAAVLSIMLVGSKLQQKVVLRGKMWQYIGGLLIVSIAAQVGTMPLTLHYFGQTSNYFALTNLIVIPMAGVLLWLGFSTLAMSWCVVGEWLGVATKWCTWVLREAVEWIERLPFSTTQISLSSESVAGLYCAIICGLLMLRGGKVHWWWLIGVVTSLVVILICELGLLC